MSLAVPTKPFPDNLSGHHSALKWGSGLLLALLLHTGLILCLTYRPDPIQPAADLPPIALMLLPSTQPESTAVSDKQPDEVKPKQLASAAQTAEQQQDLPQAKPTPAPRPEIVAAKKVHRKASPKPEPVKAPEKTQAPAAAPSSLTSPPPGNPQPSQTTPGVSPVRAPLIEHSNWASLLLQRLERYKRYPAQALRQQARGVVYLTLTVSRDGTLLNVQLVKSSGVPSLDSEAQALPARAAPLPALTEDIAPGQSQVTVTLPIRFDLRQ